MKNKQSRFLYHKYSSNTIDEFGPFLASILRSFETLGYGFLLRGVLSNTQIDEKNESSFHFRVTIFRGWQALKFLNNSNLLSRDLHTEL